jgi:hypothetical protein
MSWSIWQTWSSRDPADRRRGEPPASPRMNPAPAPSRKFLQEIFRPPTPAREDEPAEAVRCVSQTKEAQVP